MMPHIDLAPWAYHVGWSLWLLWLIVLESLALIDDDSGDTFSEHVWWLIFDTNGRPRPVVYYLVAGFLVWLVVHFLLRGRYG